MLHQEKTDRWQKNGWADFGMKEKKMKNVNSITDTSERVTRRRRKTFKSVLGADVTFLDN